MLSTIEKVLFLKSIELFSQTRGEALAEIGLIALEELHETGDEIFAEGDSGDALYLVLEGKVRVHRQGQTLAELGERECFGEMALLDSETRSANVTTMGPTGLLKISREDFQELLVEKPEIALGIIKVLTARLRRASP